MLLTLGLEAICDTWLDHFCMVATCLPLVMQTLPSGHPTAGFYEPV